MEKHARSKWAYSGAVHIDFSKAFDTINNYLLIVKLGAKKLNAIFINLKKLILGVFKESVLRLILFNINHLNFCCRDD